MDNHPNTLETIFCEAVDIVSADERAAYLGKACGNNPQLREQVQKLLDAHFRAGNFLDQPPLNAAPTIDPPKITEGPGKVIGRYKLLQQIGEGGFGVVFMAEQVEPVRRKVALKIIKPGMDTKQVIARFQAEQQALALMDHPNIARVFDGGTTESGRPYFVMELVRGIPITDYCDQNNLTPKERLELFVSACQAVQHAHQKGVVHRDIKPSNVLVTLHDGTPMVKVIDFGIAKAIDKPLTERTLFTEFGQMIGTPAYMSPEQAELSALDVDTRTDVYSLGVLLYELLTGATPFDKKRLREAAFDEVRRIIREEVPPMPSKKLSTLEAGLDDVSAHRKTEPKKLSALVRGDLDWIVMKSLEKDRARRYETAAAFAADVQRHLNDAPILARPPSVLYRLRKFIHRRRLLVASCVLVMAVLLAGIGVSQLLARRSEATRATELADLENRASVLTVDGKHPEAEQVYRELLKRQVERLDIDAPETIRTMDKLGECLREQKRWEEAAEFYEQAWKGRGRAFGYEHPETHKAMERLANSCLEGVVILSGGLDGPPIDLGRARNLASRPREAGRFGSDFGLAWVEYRAGNSTAALAGFERCLQDPGGSGAAIFLPLALVEWNMGHHQRACDWYLASGEVWGIVTDLKRKAASVLKLPADFPGPNAPPSVYLAAFDRLIADYPNDVSLLERRGSRRAALGDWARASDDYARAAELAPNYLPNWISTGLFSLQAGNVPRYKEACRTAVKTKSTTFRMEVRASPSECQNDSVIVCSLAPFADLDREEVLQIAQRTPVADVGDNAKKTATAMALYRCGRFADAITSAADLGGTREVVLSQLVRAMSYHRLEDSTKAHQLLAQARDRIASEELTCAKDPHLWCYLQIPLREAESLIEPSAKAAGAKK